ncbi:MAG: cell division protein ZapB [Fibrobacter sp.]|nr:cell division protein ZapB [Fibrobacter sp.]
MSIEFLNDLENKVQALISKLDDIRQENSRLKEELEQSGEMMAQMENDNVQLKSELESIKADSQSKDEKLSVTAERIQGLLAKLEAVQ